MMRLVLCLLLPLCHHLSQGCRILYTRKELERTVRKSHRGARALSPLLDNPTIPGTAGKDYPVVKEIPETSFSCDGRMDHIYGDPGPESKCQVFHRCVHEGNSSGLKLAKSKLGTLLIKTYWYLRFRYFLLTLAISG